MPTKGQQIVIIVAVVVLALAFLTLSSGVPDIIDGTGSKSEVNCKVKIDGDLFSSADIESASCIKTGDTCLGLFSLEPLGIISQEGTVVYDAGDVRKTEDISVSRFDGSETSTKTLCTNSESITIKLLDEDGMLIDSTITEVQ